jgi:radical SAM protein with 4Fe4S-binding SPASM domain
VFDRKNSDYIAFDHEAREIFEASLTQSLDEIYQRVADSTTRQSFDTFIQLCSSIGLFDNGVFQGANVNNADDALSTLTAPIQVNFQPTRYNNLAQKHCWAGSGEPRARELTILEVKNLLDQMAGLGIFKIRLDGGEPLGRGDCFEIIEYANSKGIKVSLATNATMATKAVAGKLGELDIADIEVSLDASSEKGYDYIAGVRSYRKAMRGIRNLKDAVDAPLYFKSTIQRDNLTEIPALVKQAEKHNVSKIIFTTVIPVGRARENPKILLSAEEINNALDLAKRIGQNSRIGIETPGKVPPPYGQKRLFEGFGSEEGHVTCYVASDGTVSPSGLLVDTMPAGNIREKTLREIWQSSTTFKNIRSAPGNPVCNACDYFRSCRGGSRARAYVTLGSLTEPDPICSIASEAVR